MIQTTFSEKGNHREVEKSRPNASYKKDIALKRTQMLMQKKSISICLKEQQPFNLKKKKKSEIVK